MLKLPTEFHDFILKNIFSKLVAAFFLIGLFLLIFFQKNDILLAINKNIANSSFDTFFIYLSDSALGTLFIIPAIVLLFFSYRKAAIIVSCGLLILIISALCKQVFFPDFPRPTSEIPFQKFFHVIPDFNYKEKFSFPSGHTISAFGFATIASFLTKNKSLHLLLFIYALSIAFSRLYLLQHFYMDVYAGAIIGFITALSIIALFPIFQKIPERGFVKK